MLVNYTTWKRLNENTDEIDSSGAVLIVKANGTKGWWLNGERHRADGPAIETPVGYKYWYQRDMLHRVDGPATEAPDGSKWWYLDGDLHRVDGPAVETAYGSKEWWFDGNRHRVDGPAVEHADGTKGWYLNGVNITYNEFIKSLDDILDGSFVQKRGIIATKADAIKGITPDAAEIKTILGIRDNGGDILSELEGALDGSKDSVGLVKMAKAIAAVFGGDISIVKWLKTELQNKFNGSEIDIILNYFHKNTFELEGLDSLFGHNNDADW